MATDPSAFPLSFLRQRRQALTMLSVLLSLIPLALLIRYVVHNGVNVPQGDEWDASVPIVVKTLDGTLTPGDLIRQHNEHRVLFTNLITILLTLTTDWNVKVGMYLNVALAAVNLLLLVTFDVP